jgi:hypothetical protein
MIAVTSSRFRGVQRLFAENKCVDCENDDWLTSFPEMWREYKIFLVRYEMLWYALFWQQPTCLG